VAVVWSLLHMNPPVNTTIRFDVVYFCNGTESHRYSEEWTKTPFFCMSCGKKSVWKGDEDYETGASYICGLCGFHHTANYIRDASFVYEGRLNEPDHQRFLKLRFAQLND
jgi:predicted RNA-binding Zn-ribbon protein involved in translation (DUF1610 family)